MSVERAEESRTKPLSGAPDSGFVRLSSARSTLIMDTGTPETDAAVTGFGTLAFEFAVGQHLLVVNPGQTASNANLQQLLCSTKALVEHSSCCRLAFDAVCPGLTTSRC